MSRKGKRKQVFNSFTKRKNAKKKNRDSVGKFIRDNSTEEEIFDNSDSPDNSSQEIDANFLGTHTACNLTSSALSLIMDKEIKDRMSYYCDLQSQIKDDLVSHRNESIKKARELCPKLFEFLSTLSASERLKRLLSRNQADDSIEIRKGELEVCVSASKLNHFLL